MRDKGELPTGKKVGGKADFFIAAADVPIDPPAGWEPKSLKAKIEPAASSCRRSSAWMPAWCGAIWRGLPSTGVRRCRS